MPAKSAANSGEARDRPFDASVVKLAQALAARYRIHIGEESDHGFAGTVAEFPGVIGYGTSEAAAIYTTRDLLTWTIAYLIETGRTPTPSE
jgi:hypothetical protein